MTTHIKGEQLMRCDAMGLGQGQPSAIEISVLVHQIYIIKREYKDITKTSHDIIAELSKANDKVIASFLRIDPSLLFPDHQDG
jgi:hypothetical protein